MQWPRRCGMLLLFLMTLTWAKFAGASMSQRELPGRPGEESVTVFFPERAQSSAWPGNGRLLVISHGSGGWPGLHTDLASALVDAGYVVAFPHHKGDRQDDDGHQHLDQ